MPNEAASKCKKEKKPDAPESKLKDIGNIVMKSRSGLFSSNIFCEDVLSALSEELQGADGNRPATTIFASAAHSKGKEDCVELGSSSDEDCALRSDDVVILDEPTLKDPPESPIKHSKQTLSILKKLEALTNLGGDSLLCTLDEDSSDDLVCLDSSPVKEDRHLVLLIQCQCRLLRMTIGPEDTFEDIFHQLAGECEVTPSQVVLTWKRGHIQQEDTPSSLGITPADILECIVKKCAPVTATEISKRNAITIKFQCSNKRLTENVQVSKDEPLSEGIKEFATKASLDPSKLVFKFDGEKVDPQMSPDQLCIEDGDCVDVLVRS